MTDYKENKIFIAIILGALIIGIFCYFAILQKSASQQSDILPIENIIKDSPPLKIPLRCKAIENTIVTKVIDGDTVIVEGGEHIRLLGIDSDEKGYPCFESAKKRLEELVLNKQIILEKDITDVDRYERCLRTIFLGNQNINLELVKEGLAVARFYEPDIKYKKGIVSAEKQAVENSIGCKWSK